MVGGALVVAASALAAGGESGGGGCPGVSGTGSQNVDQGEWGGSGAILTIGATSATFSRGCDYLLINQLTSDPDGGFSASGTRYPKGACAPSYAATIVGKVTGKQLIITTSYVDQLGGIQSYTDTLALGYQPSPWVCSTSAR